MTDFEQIYTDYYAAVYGYCLRLCRNQDLAEEITQEAFFRALKSIGRFQGDCKLNVWLCQIAKNTYFTLLEKQKRIGGEPSEDWEDTTNLEQLVSDRETGLEIHKVLHNLSEPYREVFWLRALGELSFSQIAALFGKTESWARVTYHRAKLKIKEDIG